MGEMGFKGFNKGLVCKDKQYAENTVFEEPRAVICESGMHYCKNPLDVLDYYGLLDNDCNFNEFATVEPLAEEKTDDNKKFCTTKLKIGAKFSFSGFVKACVDFVIEKTSFEESESKKDSAKLASSGDSAKLASSGDYAQLASSGDSAQLASSGDYAQLASSGDSAKLASSGDSAKLASSGDYAQLASSGDSAKLASSGDYAKVDSTGLHAVVMCAGYNSIARAKKGSFITLAEWKKDDNNKWIPINVVAEKVDGERIKEDTYYKLLDGKFVEVE